MNSSAQRIIAEITDLCDHRISLMEVCGTHTMAIARAGIRKLMPKNLRLLSGPGCPVCVTPQDITDYAIAIAEKKDSLITTFGDMVRVPGSKTSLEIYHPHIVYSIMDALSIAAENPGKDVVFIGVGFETTSPSIAAAIIEAEKRKLRNFLVISAFKLIPPALEFIARSPKIKVNGFILPGHVSTIIGAKPYQFIADKYHISGCITGFEPIDILQGIRSLVDQIRRKTAHIDIEYTRAVKPEGNKQAMTILNKVFEPCDSKWRGIGMIPGSGLRLRAEFRKFDAMEKYQIELPISAEPKGCICGKVLLGLNSPSECALFGKRCTPGSPVGACMVSSEGSCAAYFRYGVK